MTFQQIYAPETTDDGGSEGLLAVVVSRADERAGRVPVPMDGVHFLTPREANQQVALIRHPAGHVIPPHVHHPVPRHLTGTQEVLVVLSGRMMVTFFTSRGEFVTCREVCGGDVVVLLWGGHGITFSEPTELWEVKQGPYLGRDLDKKELAWPARKL